MGSMLGSGRALGVGNGNLLHYSCQENSMERGAWQATVHGVAKGQTGLNDQACTHTHTHTHTHTCTRYLHAMSSLNWDIFMVVEDNMKMPGPQYVLVSIAICKKERITFIKWLFGLRTDCIILYNPVRQISSVSFYNQGLGVQSTLYMIIAKQVIELVLDINS